MTGWHYSAIVEVLCFECLYIKVKLFGPHKKSAALGAGITRNYVRDAKPIIWYNILGALTASFCCCCRFGRWVAWHFSVLQSCWVYSIASTRWTTWTKSKLFVSRPVLWSCTNIRHDFVRAWTWCTNIRHDFVRAWTWCTNMSHHFVRAWTWCTNTNVSFARPPGTMHEFDEFRTKKIVGTRFRTWRDLPGG